MGGDVEEIRGRKCVKYRVKVADASFAKGVSLLIDQCYQASKLRRRSARAADGVPADADPRETRVDQDAAVYGCVPGKVGESSCSVENAGRDTTLEARSRK